MTVRAKTAALAVAVMLAATPALAVSVTEGVSAYEGGDFAGALKTLTPFAEMGEARAQLTLGSMYVYGRGVPLMLPPA